MTEIVTLAEAVAAAIRDGDTVAMEGFTHLIPHAAGQEVIRQRRRDLTLVRMTPDIIYDLLIGAGCARKLVCRPGRWATWRWRRAERTRRTRWAIRPGTMISIWRGT